MPVVRRATPADAALLADLNSSVQDWHAATYPDRFNAAPDSDGFARHFAEELSDPEVICFVSGDPAQGYALCRINDRAASAFSPPHRRLYIAGIGVAPGARRQGHGQALIAAARTFAHDQSCAEVLLDTWALNTTAHRFFESQGFAVQRLLYSVAP